jgi:type II secretory pathway pseudopilin PulG
VDTVRRKTSSFRPGAAGAAPRPAPDGLTLVEMLVVASVMVVVSSLLLPIVVRTAEEARKVVCATNLRQIGLGLQNYATEYGTWLPYRSAFERCQMADEDGNHTEALGLLIQRRHMANIQTFFCPSEPENKREVVYGPEAGQYLGNYDYFGADTPERNRLGAAKGERTRAVVADFGISMGATVLNLLDRTGKTHLGDGHSVLFLGGNVRWLPLAQTAPEDPLQTEPDFTKLDGR